MKNGAYKKKKNFTKGTCMRTFYRVMSLLCVIEKENKGDTDVFSTFVCYLFDSNFVQFSEQLQR